MATHIVSTSGNSSYNGPILDVIDFEAPGAATLSVASNFLRTSAPGVLAVSFLGSPNPDTVAIQMIDSKLDARAVTFGEGWTGLADTVVIRDTGLDSTIWGTTRADRIETTGGNDSVDGSGGTDTLVAVWTFRSEDFAMDGTHRIAASDGTAVAYAGIERLDIRLGSGNDNVKGLGGRDTVMGGLGNDVLGGLGGDDKLFGNKGGDILRGNQGRDFLDGGLGNDTMVGGDGDDIFVMNSLGDKAVESAGQGNDTLRSVVSVDLAMTNIENATLLGSADISASGGAGRNLLRGNAGSNTLDGGAGRDDLRGGGDEGVDHFHFWSVADSTGKGRDSVRGFDAANEDRISIQLSGDIAEDFAGLAVSTKSGGALDSDSFNADLAAALNPSLAAGGLNQAILWDPTSGGLNVAGHRYLVIDMDNDGSYAAGKDMVIQFINMQGTLGTSDFVLSAVL